MFVCMARQNIEHSTDKEDNGLIGDSSIFPIIFDAQTGMEIQIGGTYSHLNPFRLFRYNRIPYQLIDL